MSNDNDSEEEFISKRKLVKNLIESDDENGDSDSTPINTEDIVLRLSDDEDNNESNRSIPLLEEHRQINCAEISEDLNSENAQNDVSQSPSHVNLSPTLTLPTTDKRTLQIKKVNRVPFHLLIDSDSEPEESSQPVVESELFKKNVSADSNDAEPSKRVQGKCKPAKQKHRSIWDSDEDGDEKVITSKPSGKHYSIWDSDSDEAEAEEVDTSKKTSEKLSSLFDSDSDDANQPKENFAQSDPRKKDSGKLKKASASMQKKENSKNAMMTIRSESQRMTRESAISLPYHRPKQHSLSDFLNRPRLAPTSIKASVEELVKFQKESLKEIKEFYQSESEHSDDDKDDDPDWNEGLEKNEKEEEIGAGEEIEFEAEKKSENEDREAEDRNCEDTRMKIDKIQGSDEKNDEETLKESNNETLKKSEEKRKKNDNGKMETEEIVFDEKLDNQNEIGSINNVVQEENAEDKEDEDVTNQKEQPDRKEGSQVEKDVQNEKDTQDIDKEMEGKMKESKKSQSCPINSQDVRLKYSEDLSEAFEKRKMNFDPISDSEDEDVQMVKELPKPKEESKIILKGKPNDVIDLDDDFTTHKGKTEDLEGLKNRFMRHSLSSKPKASPETLSIKVVDLAPDGSIKGINEETVAWSSEKAFVDHTPPGLKMKMLKKELQRQIIERREKEFEEKESSAVQVAKDDYEDGDDDVLDDKEDIDGVSTVGGNDEASADDTDDDVEDEMDEDEEICERPRKKNAFVDDEASVEDGDEEKGLDLDDDEDDEEDNKGAQEDDEGDKEDEDDKEDGENGNSTHGNKSQFSRTDTNGDMFASQMSDDDGMIPAYQPCGGRRNASPLPLLRTTQTCSEKNADDSLRLPEITQGSPISSFQRISRFDSYCSSQNTDFSTNQILKSFPEENKDAIMQLAQSPEILETEADLMAMCSGQFTTQPFPVESQGGNLARNDDSATADSQDSQDLQLKWTEDSPTDESKSTAKVTKTRLIIESSDEEDDDEAKTTTKRKTQPLSFSDDESNSVDADDFINDNEEEEEEDDELPDPADVMYDSDENEIPIKNGAAFLENEAELSEDEYVGSGDEDEGGDNDQMEEELGDLDEFDQDKVREELGRIHMRNILDDDRRDVRLMQEMLLEDGELHGDGKVRQRQFRWKNADLAILTAYQPAGSDEEKVDEDEDDGEWRQNRHEREMFLAGVLKDKDGKSIEVHVEEEQEDSELMVLGKSVLKRQSSTRIEIKETTSKPAQQSAIPDSPMKSFLSRTHSRGSFLSRTSDVLTRLAQNASGKNGIVETKTKNSRNFVFAAISPPKESSDDIENEHRPNAKRKAKRSLISQPEKKSCNSQSSGYTGLFNYL